MLRRGSTDPFPIPAGSWQQNGQPQQLLPMDDVPGLETNGYLMFEDAGRIIRGQLPFWGEMPATLDPSNTQFNPWDVVFLGGQQLPGLCQVTGKRGKRYDLKKAKGSDFARITKQGYEPAEIRIVERIWTRQHLHALELIMPMLEAPTPRASDGSEQAIEIRHPALDLRGINAVVIQRIDFLRDSSIKGMKEQEIVCLEWKPTKGNATTTVDGATMYNVKTVTNQRFTKGPSQPQPPFADPGPNGGRGG